MGAPLQPVPGVLRVVLEGFTDSSDATSLWANVLHFTFGGTAPSGAICGQIGVNIAGAWNAQVASLCPSPTTLQIVSVTDLSSNTAGTGEAEVLHPGTRGDDFIPANAAVLISYPVTTRYKGGHPRSYLYVLGNADMTSPMLWTPAATAEVQTKWGNFLGQCTLAGTGGTVISSFCAVRYRGKFLPNAGPPHYYLNNPEVLPIGSTSGIARQQMASQRGRIERRSA